MTGHFVEGGLVTGQFIVSIYTLGGGLLPPSSLSLSPLPRLLRRNEKNDISNNDSAQLGISSPNG
jgi:hypothetical protein